MLLQEQAGGNSTSAQNQTSSSLNQPQSGTSAKQAKAKANQVQLVKQDCSNRTRSIWNRCIKPRSANKSNRKTNSN